METNTISLPEEGLNATTLLDQADQLLIAEALDLLAQLTINA